ncbi:MAG TPA: Si-specific NAD(P)(+) transhydrogenase [Pirellulaceae bacterium]|nr:Si-specific NAD(P)(+) transhydrogenase [Pirellulaceae bacterium]
MGTHYDVAIIGSGPGGEGAAMQLAKASRRVVVIERYNRVGGGCTHWGTIPSKALRAAILNLTETLNSPWIRLHGGEVRVGVADLCRSAQGVIDSQVALRHKFYVRNDVDVVHGQARFVDATTLEVGDRVRITADKFVIATGSRPYRPAEIDFNHPAVFDSDTILSLNSRPQTMTIFGAGVVGCEYASMFRNLDVKINLINNRNELLDFLDEEISGALSYHMRERGVLIRHNESYERLTHDDRGVTVHLQSGKHIRSEVLLWAAGRTGNSDNLGLDVLGVNPDNRGYVAVNQHFQTVLPHIYAVGDVIGFPSLASAAYSQGRAAARHILGLDDNESLADEVPSGIYTSPEISSIGKTERQLTAEKIPYEVGNAHFKSIARAQILGQTSGLLKILFHRETLAILGVHCFGWNASEIIHIGQAIMAQPGAGNSLKYFLNTTFNYPTMAEAYRVAALNGYNRVATEAG